MDWHLGTSGAVCRRSERGDTWNKLKPFARLLWKEGRGHWLKALSPIAVVHNCEANTCVIHPWNPWFALSVMLICTAEHLGSGRRYSHSPGADTDPWSGPCSRTGMVEAPGVSHKHDHLYWWPMDDLWMTYGWPMDDLWMTYGSIVTFYTFHTYHSWHGITVRERSNYNHSVGRIKAHLLSMAHMIYVPGQAQSAPGE